jgi:hypothetical protein
VSTQIFTSSHSLTEFLLGRSSKSFDLSTLGCGCALICYDLVLRMTLEEVSEALRCSVFTHVKNQSL